MELQEYTLSMALDNLYLFYNLFLLFSLHLCFDDTDIPLIFVAEVSCTLYVLLSVEIWSLFSIFLPCLFSQ